MRPFPDVQRGSRQVSVEVGFAPVWSGSGDELFFGSRPGFSSVAVHDGQDFSMGGPERLFSNRLSAFNTVFRAYDYDDRSDRFLMIRTVSSERPMGMLLETTSVTNPYLYSSCSSTRRST